MNEDIIFHLYVLSISFIQRSYLNDTTMEINYLYAILPFAQLRKQSNQYGFFFSFIFDNLDQWITIYKMDTKAIAGALQICIVSRLSPCITKIYLIS